MPKSVSINFVRSFSILEFLEYRLIQTAVLPGELVSVWVCQFICKGASPLSWAKLFLPNRGTPHREVPVPGPGHPASGALLWGHLGPCLPGQVSDLHLSDHWIQLKAVDDGQTIYQKTAGWDASGSQIMKHESKTFDLFNVEWHMLLFLVCQVGLKICHILFKSLLPELANNSRLMIWTVLRNTIVFFFKPGKCYCWMLPQP